MIRNLKRLFVYVLMTAFTFVGFSQPVLATMIGTEQIVAANAGEDSRAKIAAALDRPDVMAQLEKFGVDKLEAQARVAAMTDAEAAELAGRVDNLPAGADGFIGTLIFIFVLLLITDILGFTKVFPFTRSVR
jgi:hypothetical protein